MSLVQTRDPVETSLSLTSPRNRQRVQKVFHEYQRKPRVELVCVAGYREKIGELEQELVTAQERLKAFEEANQRLREINHELRVQSEQAKIRPQENNESYPTLEQIIAKIAEDYGVRVNDIKSASRTKHIIEPRQAFYYFAKTKTLMSYPTIGRFCGDRDHATVHAGARTYARKHNKPMP